MAPMTHLQRRSRAEEAHYPAPQVGPSGMTEVRCWAIHLPKHPIDPTLYPRLLVPGGPSGQHPCQRSHVPAQAVAEPQN
jgi:hypothetical protein